MHSGLGIRPELFEEVARVKPKLGFIEAHSENYFGDSVLRDKLLELNETYDVSLHGVGLSLGRADSLSKKHLRQLRRLIDDVNPVLVSEHLAWSAYSHVFLPDLLPLPLSEVSLALVADHIQEMQDYLGRQILLENPSNYVLFERAQIPEHEFLNRLVAKSGCGLLLDLNNVYVSSVNLSRDPTVFVDGLEGGAIGEYHLAGFTPVERNNENLLIDTHNHPVHDNVWRLFEHTVKKFGSRPTLFEWDSDFPELDILLAECGKAESYLQGAASTFKRPIPEEHLPKKAESVSEKNSYTKGPLANAQESLLKFLLSQDSVNQPSDEFSASGDLADRWWIYQNNVQVGLVDYLLDVYPATTGVVGDDFFRQIARECARRYPPESGNLHAYGAEFIKVLDAIEQLDELPYLKKLVEFEWALHFAYFAAIEKPLAVDQMSEAQLLSSTIDFKKEVYFSNSRFPILEIHRQSLPSYIEEVDIKLTDELDYLLVQKFNGVVRSISISELQFQFLTSIDQNGNLLSVIEQLMKIDEQDRISKTLAWVITSDLLVARKVDIQ